SEHPYCTFLLAESRTSDVQDIVQLLHGDGAVYAKIRTRAFRQFALEFNIYGEGAVLSGWINAYHLAGDDAIVSIDLCRLPGLNVLGGGFGNLEFGLQMLRLDDLRQYGSLRSPLANLDINFLQKSGDTSSDLESVKLLVSELGQGTHLVDLCLRNC